MERRVARMNIADFEKMLESETDPERSARIRRLLAKERAKLTRLEDAAIFSDMSSRRTPPTGSNPA